MERALDREDVLEYKILSSTFIIALEFWRSEKGFNMYHSYGQVFQLTCQLIRFHLCEVLINESAR